MIRALAKTVLALLLCAAALPAAAATEEVINGRVSGNWAGYIATRGTYTGVGATWVVPAVAATSTLMTDVTWVGVGGSKTNDLIQAGTQGAVQNGRVQYWAWYELLPDYQKIIPLTVMAGDKVSVSLTELSKGLWFLSFSNLTTGNQHYMPLEYRSRYSSAEWVEEMPVVYDRNAERLYAPLAEFSSVTFTDAWAIVDGERKSAEDARARAVTMVSTQNRRVVLATPQGLSEDTFSVVRSGAVPSPVPFLGSSKRNRAQAWEIQWSR